MDAESEELPLVEMGGWRKRIGYWSLITFGVLLSYVFVYPIFLFAIEPIYYRWESLEDAVDISVIPLDYLHEWVPLYQAFIDWADSLFWP